MRAKFCHNYYYFFILLHSDYFPHLSSDDFEYSKRLSRPKDVSDYEWDVFSTLILSYLPWTICHTVVTVLLKSAEPKVGYMHS